MKTPISILVVEDDVIICEDIRTTLERFGYPSIHTVSSGEEAVEYVQKEKPDFVLMDIVLSGLMNGIEAGERINRESDSSVIFLSAYTDQLTLDRIKKVGSFGYVSKPFHKDELKNTLETAIKKRSGMHPVSGNTKTENP